ncbi:MAG: hypothetical protein B5M56_08145 [Desulfococcus sp. 4484_241]|nr:MAG: hypothetical protein B5M56_08145 [Desulfococcus sp. 4484_241]
MAYYQPEFYVRPDMLCKQAGTAMKEKTNVKVLVVLDRHQDDGESERQIEKTLEGFDIVKAYTQKEYESALASFQPLVIVADYPMACLEITDAIKKAQEVLPGIPLIVLTDASSEDTIVKCLEAGAWDYVLKEHIRGLPFVIRNAVKIRLVETSRELAPAMDKKRMPRIASLLNHLPGMVYRCHNDRKWTMEFVSEGCFALTGYRPEELEKNRVVAFADLIHPEDRDRVWNEIRNALARFAPYQLTYRIINRKGETRWVWEHGAGVRENGRWLLDGFIWDITDKKQAEDRLHEQDEKFRLFMENTRSLLAIFDNNVRYEYVSPSHRDLLGYEPEELVGKSGFEFVHPDETGKFTGLLAKGLKGEMARVHGIEYKVLDKEGRTHYIRGNFDSVSDSEGNLKNIIFVGGDVTALRQTSEALGREREKTSALIEKSPLGMLLLDDKGLIADINSRFTEMFGYTPDDIKSWDEWLEAAYPNTEYRQQIAKSWSDDLAKGDSGNGLPQKHVVTCKDGSEKTVLFFFTAMTGGEKLLVAQDITRQEALEAQFMHAQKMESIGRLASGIAHDFNNLLTSITGNADFALMDIDPQDPMREVITDIKEAADRAANLTRQLLTFSRRQIQSPELIDINEKIKETKNMLDRLLGENIELTLALADDLCQVEMDPGQLEQVIMNLAVNAKDAMAEGGKLTIETANVELDETDPTSPLELPPGRYALLSITDTGTGMSGKVRSQAFEPFFTTKEKGKGTGLGLSTVYGIVKQSRGNILIYSEPGKGTTVKIFIPACAETGPAPHKTEHKGKNLYGTETVLVAEDEERVRKIVTMMLARYGYNVIEADCGEEAQRLFKTSNRHVDLLLTDMIMPGINGLELAKSLRETSPELKVICMSGYTDTALFDKIKKEGFLFVHKPFTAPDLLGKIRELLDS